MNEVQYPPIDMARFNPFAAMTVTSEIDAGYVSDRRQEIKSQLKEIEETRKRFTGPLMESKKRIDEQAKKLSTPLEAIVRVLDTKLIAWHQSQEQIRFEAERKKREEEAARLEEEKYRQLQTALITGDQTAADAVCEIEKHQERLETKPLEIVRNTKTGNSTTYLQQRWTFEVIDADQVPREFLMIDESKLQKFATDEQEKAVVPGVRFFQKASIGGRR